MNEKIKNHRRQQLIFIIAVWFMIIFSVCLDWNEFRFQLIFWAQTITPFMDWYSIGISLLMADLVCYMIGTYILVRERKTNLCLLLALIISIIGVVIKGNQIDTLLSSYFYIPFTFSYFGIGFNLAGLILLFWYLRLNQAELTLKQLSG